MKRNFDKFLLGLLWLMTIALALTFWMNIRYGFNVLSAAHWQYLSTLQAARATIKPEFYISLVVGIFVGLFGMYLLMRPYNRKSDTFAPEPAQPQPTNYLQTTPARPMSPSGMRSVTTRPTHRTATATSNILPAPTPTKNENILADEIKHIFEGADYIVKPCKKIGKLINPIIALGYNNSVWIGTSDTSTDAVQDAIQTLIAIFDDTLGDTANDMSVHGCIIKPTDANNTNPDLISTFATIQEFGDFMNQHKNLKPDDFDSDLFDAVSTYITTVIGYAGKS